MDIKVKPVFHFVKQLVVATIHCTHETHISLITDAPVHKYIVLLPLLQRCYLKILDPLLNPRLIRVIIKYDNTDNLSTI